MNVLYFSGKQTLSVGGIAKHNLVDGLYILGSPEPLSDFSGDIPSPRYGHFFREIDRITGNIILYGGRTSLNDPTGVSNEIFLLSMLFRKWHRLFGTPSGTGSPLFRRYSAACALVTVEIRTWVPDPSLVPGGFFRIDYVPEIWISGGIGIDGQPKPFASILRFRISSQGPDPSGFWVQSPSGSFEHFSLPSNLENIATYGHSMVAVRGTGGSTSHVMIFGHRLPGIYSRAVADNDASPWEFREFTGGDLGSYIHLCSDEYRGFFRGALFNGAIITGGVLESTRETSLPATFLVPVDYVYTGRYYTIDDRVEDGLYGAVGRVIYREYMPWMYVPNNFFLYFGGSREKVLDPITGRYEGVTSNNDMEPRSFDIV